MLVSHLPTQELMKTEIPGSDDWAHTGKTQNATPGNLGFLKQCRVSVSHVFSTASCDFKDSQILEPVR